MNWTDDRQAITNQKAVGAPFEYEFANISFADMENTLHNAGLVDKRYVGESILTFVNTTNEALTVNFYGNDGENDFDLTGSPLSLAAGNVTAVADYALVTEPWVYVHITVGYAQAPTEGTLFVRHCNGAGKYDV